jgi:hypothetical protein
VIRARDIFGFAYLVAFDLAVNALDFVSAARIDIREKLNRWTRT